MNTIPLEGCTPEPLMSFLKALGVLRIIAEQDLDPGARGFWKDNVFCLRTKLTKDGIIQFFSNNYQPSPILSPWNGDAGFLAETGAGYEAIETLISSKSPRLQPIRDAIEKVQSIDLFTTLSSLRVREKELKRKNKKKKLVGADAAEFKAATAEIKRLKGNVIYKLRGSFPEALLGWLDSCMVIGTDGFKPAPHLGSGGVDGKMEFSVNYIKNMLLVLEDSRSGGWFEDAVFGGNRERNVSSSIGLFAPGSIGGANGTHGTEGSSAINPWDFVLMIEGSVLLAGSASRKLGTSGGSKSAFPFTMNPAPVGMATLTDSDEGKAKGELWLPLWERPASIGELAQLFAEGRADLNGRQARDGVDFSRAVAALGVDRGIKSFSRLSFLQRNGLSFIATPLGRFEVSAKSDAALLRESDTWLARYRQAAGDKDPARFQTALREIERAIFDYCQYGETGGEKSRFQRILIALGNAEKLVAGAPKFRAEAKGLYPLSALSHNWIEAADDRSAEFEIALALASICCKELGSIRLNLEEVEWKGSRYHWADNNHAAVWTGADLPTNLAAILYRRVMNGDKAGNPSLALQSSHRAALTSIGDFLAGSLDDAKITDLLWGLSLCKVGTYPRLKQPTAADGEDKRPPLPVAYALLKLLFHGPTADPDDEQATMSRPDLAILGLLRADRMADACQRAVRTLRARNFRPMPFAMHGFPSRDHEWSECADTLVDARTLAAALLVPISNSGIGALEKQILRKKEPNES